MPRFDASSARCDVLTFKEGLLSAVAHDLRIAVTTFAIDADFDARTVTATFDARSLRVVTALRDGVEAPETLSDRDRKQIDKQIIEDVLAANRHPEVRFTSKRVEPRGDGWEITGALTLHGQTRDVRVDVRRVGAELIAEAKLDQPEFGIRPFSAMLGALKVKREILIRVGISVDQAPTLAFNASS